jgi:WD40 repeat protein
MGTVWPYAVSRKPWQPRAALMSSPPSGTSSTEKDRLFLSYGRADAEELAERLESDLALLGFEVWRDRRKIRSGKEWDAASRAELAFLRGHADEVTSVACDLEGRRIVSGSEDNMVRVWEAESGACLKVIEGSGDVAAIAAAGAAFPWHALRRGLETVIEPAAGGNPIAWFPAALDHITTHPSRRIWAWAVRNHLYIITLEGEPDRNASRGIAP